MPFKNTVKKIYGKLGRNRATRADTHEDKTSAYPLKHSVVEYDIHHTFSFGDGVNDEFLDICYPSKRENIRVYGVGHSMSCLDFTIRLCSEMQLNPGDYAVVVANPDKKKTLQGNTSGNFEFDPSQWIVPPPSSSLLVWTQPTSTKCREPDLLPRLLTKEFLRNMSKQNAFRVCSDVVSRLQLPNQPSTNEQSKSGRKLLNELGDRLIFYLPKGKKVVVRARSDQLVSESVAKVCANHKLNPVVLRVRNPRTGALIDPNETLMSQNVTNELELQECDPLLSNLKFLKRRSSKVLMGQSREESIYARLAQDMLPEMVTGRIARSCATLQRTKRMAPAPPRGPGGCYTLKPSSHSAQSPQHPALQHSKTFSDTTTQQSIQSTESQNVFFKSTESLPTSDGAQCVLEYPGSTSDQPYDISVNSLSSGTARSIYTDSAGIELPSVSTGDQKQVISRPTSGGKVDKLPTLEFDKGETVSTTSVLSHDDDHFFEVTSESVAASEFCASDELKEGNTTPAPELAPRPSKRDLINHNMACHRCRSVNLTRGDLALSSKANAGISRELGDELPACIGRQWKSEYFTSVRASMADEN